MSQVSSAADLTASVRRTTGTRPPPLVGCSVTLLGSSIYVFGGRLVPTRTMVSTLYSLNLKTLVWSQLSPPPSPSTTAFEQGEQEEKEKEREEGREAPQARYFHSACAWGDKKLVIFGGEGYHSSAPVSPATTDTPVSSNTEEPAPALQTLDDLHIYDVESGKWEDVGEIKVKEGVERPKPRYAHLGVVCTGEEEVEVEGGGTEKREKSCLMIMGGQDIRNTYLHSTDILDLDSMTWIQTGKWDRHIGTYRAIATTSTHTVRPGTSVGEMGKDGLVGLSWSEKNQLTNPEPLLLFSNFNFTQVRRDLDLLSSPLSPSNPLTPTSLSSLMTGTSLPPGLRFPSGFQLGHHLLIFGTFLSQHLNNFSIWALDLGKRGGVGVEDMKRAGQGLEWMRVDPGSVLQRGSWNRAVGWKNQVVVLGDRERDIAADYDHRQTNFAHVAFVDLEAHGIYQPPPRPLPPIAQSFGLLSLSQPFLTDFEIVCSDNKRLACSRKILEDRWSWFNSKVVEFRVRASGVLAAQQKRAQDSSLENSEVGSIISITKSSPAIPESDSGGMVKSSSARSTTTTVATDCEARLTPRTLQLPEPSSVVLAFLQYLYTLSLCTPLQLELPILSSLLLFSKTYNHPPSQDSQDAQDSDCGNLRALVVHALHETLTRDPSKAPAIYEAATLGSCTALQIRALKALMGSSRNLGGSQQQQGGGAVQQQQAEPMARQASQDVRGSTEPSLSARSAPFSSNTPTGSRRALDSSDRFQYPLHSPRASASPPSSPPPSSSLPSTPDRPLTSTTNLSSPTSSPLSAFPTKFDDSRRSLRRSVSSSVAVPSPDTVAPVPVPVWSTFAPPTPSNPSPRRSISTNRSSVTPIIGEPADSTPSTPSRRDSLSDSPPSRTSLTASSRSRSSSTGSLASSLAPPSKTGASTWAPHVLETQEEVEEPISPISFLPTSPIDSIATSSSGELLYLGGEESENGGVGVVKKRRFASLLQGDREKGKLKSDEDQGQGDGEEAWHPMFLDSVRSKGSVANPLSTRKATPITLEHLALLEEDSTNLQLSPPIPLSPPITEDSFSHPRAAPRPSFPPSPAASDGFLSAGSALNQRRQSIDRGPLGFLRPLPPPLVDSPNSATSLLSRASTTSPRSSLSSSRQSVAMDRRPSSSSARSVSSSGSSELVTPPMPSTARFEPVIVEEEPSPSPSPLHFRNFFASKSSHQVNNSISSTNSSSHSSLVSSPPPKRTSLLPFKTTTESKEQRKQLEFDVGSKLLRASGASEKEISLRGRSVGFQVLKAKESGDYSKLPPSLLAKCGEGQRLRDAKSIGRYLGGEELGSKFSLE